MSQSFSKKIDFWPILLHFVSVIDADKYCAELLSDWSFKTSHLNINVAQEVVGRSATGLPKVLLPHKLSSVKSVIGNWKKFLEN